MNGKRAERLEQWKLKKQAKLQNEKRKTLQLENTTSAKKTKVAVPSKYKVKDKENGLKNEKKESKVVEKKEKESSAAKTSNKINMREKLEKWREEKGRNKPDTNNPLLSRKRPLVLESYKKAEKRQKKNPKESVNKDMKETEENADEFDRLPTFTHVASRIQQTPKRTPKINPTTNMSSIAKPKQLPTPKDNKRVLDTPRDHLANTPRDRTTMCFTPMRQGPRTPSAASAVTNSVLHSAPRRRSGGSKVKRSPQIQLTPYPSRFRSLPNNSVLKSAPSRRTISKTSQLVPQSQQQTPSCVKPRKFTALSEKPRRRNTIHFASNAAPTAIAAPFTPRGEWQNEGLTIRKRLDLWLSARGKTVTKPYVVIRKTPAQKRSVSMTKNNVNDKEDEDIEDELNRTFTFDDETDGEKMEQEETAKENPKMNEIERTVIEKSLQDILKRIQQQETSDFDGIKDELDLILSTSPGVIKLSLYWIARARLAAKNESIERVICLLEQSNAFDAEPQEMIREELCLYLEKLKAEEKFLQTDEEIITESDVENEKMAKPARTPAAKRVKFIDTQKHLEFGSSLIKFCLLESTPFRRRLKTTLSKHVLTPVRRSGRFDRSQARLPSILRNHVPIASSPSALTKESEDQDIYFLPNLNLETKWNDIWEKKEVIKDGEKEEKIEENKANLSF
eukprot:gene20430-22443_t